MSDQALVLEMRARIVGVLIRDARQASERTVTECAALIGVTPEMYMAYELGQRSVSLPELELLAYLLERPLSHFWGDTIVSEKADERTRVPGQAIMEVRQRMIGAKLRQSRQTARIRLKDFATDLGLAAGKLAAYEQGQQPIPLPELEVIANRLRLDLEDLLEAEGAVGEWETSSRLFERFKQMPPDLREFVSQPANEHFLRLAQHLSQMPVDQLRGIAAGLLEITL